MEFEWDEDKAESNELKHGVTFQKPRRIRRSARTDRLRPRSL